MKERRMREEERRRGRRDRRGERKRDEAALARSRVVFIRM